MKLKKLLLIALAILAFIALVWWIPEAIDEKKHDYSEKLINKQVHAEERAEDMIGYGSDGADNKFGGAYNKTARDNFNKASRRSLDRLKEMEAEQ